MKIIKIHSPDELKLWLKKVISNKRKSKVNYVDDNSNNSIFSKFNSFTEYNILTDNEEKILYYGCGCYLYQSDYFIIGSRLICGINTTEPLCAEYLLPYQANLAPPDKKTIVTFNDYNENLGRALKRHNRKDGLFLNAAQFSSQLDYIGIMQINYLDQHVWEYKK